jgi:hypothetical protein
VPDGAEQVQPVIGEQQLRSRQAGDPQRSGDHPLVARAHEELAPVEA